ncbi:MAG: hypothetical protein Kow002_07640 [Anaerolineales bacterium]
MKQAFSRRDFLKLAGLGLGSMALNPLKLSGLVYPWMQLSEEQKYGRVSVFPNFYSAEIKSQPSDFAPVVRNAPEDEILVWQREVIGSNYYGGKSRTWVETPEGYVYAPFLQPVFYSPNAPISAMPEGKPGFWAEVTVPFVDLLIANPPIRSPSFRYQAENGPAPRLYYSQVVWIDQIRTDESGRILYRWNEDFGHGYGYGDIFWADASAFRIITEEEVAPISPDVDPAQKVIVADTFYQTISCFEGNTEVFFCKMASGAGDFATPIGTMYAWRKMYSINMSASVAQNGAGYDTSAVSWPTFINGDGVAIHAAFWHNYFGTRRSHGCLNVEPEAAKWIFRWTTPYVSLDQSEVKMEWPNVGTQVIVREPSL